MACRIASREQAQWPEKAKKASSFIVMAIIGGAILPKVMGSVADKYDRRRRRCLHGGFDDWSHARNQPAKGPGERLPPRRLRRFTLRSNPVVSRGNHRAFQKRIAFRAVDAINPHYQKERNQMNQATFCPERVIERSLRFAVLVAAVAVSTVQAQKPQEERKPDVSNKALLTNKRRKRKRHHRRSRRKLAP